ncbi:YbhB/YbcL family Raf kinase inhibitor-like protein [Pigmentiphaga aceris]|uniref:YbhB/YbcL family Raf kinase inhibitor-like protein n=1 Tax=Pigmentiphaga aceris TaxID=1940612 RepID=A0A5C0AYC9_9BURK|nr:YbhB/YbcL family Raf kinase inhibitor-like protein [Pigmentiphaga aceris]QEI06584.1 YbhB/YbcL family Raf kinase inhibitor-like protein [Pigmentiphaga aceris]
MNKPIIGAFIALLCVSAQAQNFSLTSRDVEDGKQMGEKHLQNGSGCVGGDISPQLSWSGAPTATKSFAITMFDPDAPTGSGWWHWTLVNIPKTTTTLPQDAGNRNEANVPAGAVQGRTDFGNTGYGGACPPVGTHRYRFKVWALNVESIPVDKESSGALVGYLLNANSLATAELVPVSSR